jgi:xanthine dehydrogenase YagR molybdenum-binding subunit
LLGVLAVAVQPRVIGGTVIGDLRDSFGVVWGIGMALLEETQIDPHTGRYVNAELAEYLVPVNADVGTIDAHFVEESDLHVSATGSKGVGEIGITGVAASIANAVFHATGKRIRDLPLRVDRVMG